MGPFSLFASLLKLGWPFFKENLLQDGNLRDWFRRNWMACILFLYQLIMLGVCLFLADMTLRTRAIDIQTEQNLQKLRGEYQQLLDSRQDVQHKLNLELASNSRMRLFVLQRCRLYPHHCQFLIEETVRRQVDAGLPVSAAQNEEVRELWCGVIRNKDLENETTRQKYVAECLSKTAPTNGFDPTIIPPP